MHMLTNRHSGPHLYGPGGIGERQFDPSSLLTTETIVETRDLPGFVLGNTTYESHHFWIHFCRYTSTLAKEGVRDSSVLIRVCHGGGWEVWQGEYMLAEALRRYGSDNIGAFLLCWYLIDTTRTAQSVGKMIAKEKYQRAFVDGRLRKRKLPRQNKHQVWIEPEASAHTSPQG